MDRLNRVMVGADWSASRSGVRALWGLPMLRRVITTAARRRAVMGQAWRIASLTLWRSCWPGVPSHDPLGD